MGFFNFRKEERAVEPISASDFRVDKSEQELKDVLLGNDSKANIEVTRANVMQIPTMSSGVDLISKMIASLPIELYRIEDGEVSQVMKDNRLKLLNLQAEATMSAYQMKESFIKDYILEGNGFIFIEKPKNKVLSLRYVAKSDIGFMSNFDPIYKDVKIMVQGKSYETYDFINLCQNSKDGVQGKGAIEINSDLLGTVLASMNQERKLSLTGGVNRGVIKSTKKLSKEAIDALKSAWKNLYSENQNALVLNDGLDFTTVSQNSKDMELYNNKKANADLVSQILNIPKSILDGTASDEVFNNWIKTCINPILTQLETSLNNSLLLETEKDKLFFKVCTEDLLKSDTEKRFKAYELGLKNGFITIDEIRKKENLKSIPNIGGLVKLSLADVLYNPETNSVFNTNSSTTTNLNEPLENIPADKVEVVSNADGD